MMTSVHQQASHIQCWKCRQYGHPKSECPELSNKEKKEEKERLSALDSRASSSYSGLQLSQLANQAFLDE